jgi:hypothetical protein
LGFIDPYCTSNGNIQWTLENPNSVSIPVLYWIVDSGSQQSGFNANPGSTNLTTTSVGTHTVFVAYGESQTTSLTFTKDICAVVTRTPQPPTAIPTPTTVPTLPIPNTGGGGLIIPVTGADLSGSLANGLLFSGLSFCGLGLILSALRKLLKQ